MKKVAVIVKEREEQYEALRVSLGSLLESHAISMFVLDHEVEMTEEYRDNLDIFEEMDGLYFSNNRANVEKHGFTEVSVEEIAAKLRDRDIIIPYC